MAIRKTTHVAPKLNVQHNYITLKLPTGNFTTSYGGAKCSGQLVKMKGAFEALDKYVQTAAKTKSYGDAMNDLLNPCPEVMKHQVIDQDKAYAHYEGTKPVFFGHYALKYKPVIENPLAICTDYNITHGGQLVACRVDKHEHTLTTQLVY